LEQGKIAEANLSLPNVLSSENVLRIFAAHTPLLAQGSLNRKSGVRFPFGSL
jgi:hypothetical protein